LLIERTILEKSQKALYEVAKEKKHTIGETLIKPAAIATSQIMNGDRVTEEIKGTPLSANTIHRRVN